MLLSAICIRLISLLIASCAREKKKEQPGFFQGGLIPPQVQGGWGEGDGGAGGQEWRVEWLRICSSCDFSLLSLEVISPAQILLIVQSTAIRHSIFISRLFLCFFNLEFQNLSSVPSVLSCVLSTLYLFHPILFYTLLSIPCSVFCFLPLFIFLISLIAFFSNLLSFLFSFPIILFCVLLLLPYSLLLFHLFSFYISL